MKTKKIIKIIAIVIILGVEVAGSLMWLPKPLSVVVATTLPVATGVLILILPDVWRRK